jgi:hypothetical protein
MLCRYLITVLAPILEEIRQKCTSMEKVLIFCCTYDVHLPFYLESVGVQPIGAPDLPQFGLVAMYYTRCDELGFLVNHNGVQQATSPYCWVWWNSTQWWHVIRHWSCVGGCRWLLEAMQEMDGRTEQQPIIVSPINQCYKQSKSVVVRLVSLPATSRAHNGGKHTVMNSMLAAHTRSNVGAPIIICITCEKAGFKWQARRVVDRYIESRLSRGQL